MMMNNTMRFTYHDYFLLPEEKRAEIIDGDLIMEVISARHAGRDRELKMKLYAGSGVAEYWIADPETRTVEVYSLRRSVAAGQGAPLRRGMYYEVHGVFGPGNTVTSKILAGFEAKTDEMFAKPF